MTPGQAEYSQGELKRADQALLAARQLHESGALEDSASRLYYAAFHAARACITLRGLHSRTHRGLIDLFGQTFGGERLLRDLFELRAGADYDPEKFTITSAQLADRINQTAAFIERCRTIVEEAVARGPDEPDPPPDL